MQKQYGDLKLSEVINFIEENNIIKSIEDISVKCIRVYGKGCYELSGETRNISTNLKDFILKELFDLTESCAKNENEDEALDLPEDFIEYVCSAILNGYIGNSCKIHYKNIEISLSLEYEQLANLLRAVKIDGESYDDLEEKDYDDYFDM